MGSGFPAQWWTLPADAAMRDGTPREAPAGRERSQDFFRCGGQVAGRSTLEEAESSREDEAAVERLRWTADEEIPQGTAERPRSRRETGNPTTP